MKEKTLFSIALRCLFLMIVSGLILYAWNPEKSHAIVITVNQAGIVKIDGKTVQPDSVHEQHYNYKGQLFEPSVKCYSIKNK